MQDVSKKCNVCGDTKPINEFYRHSKMKDGHYNKCKKCARAHTTKYYAEKKKDPEWVARQRELYCIYQDKRRQTQIGIITKKARAAAQRIKKSGFENHHWSYLEEHHKDVIQMSYADHRKIHRYIRLDEFELQFRTLRGVLMDSRERAEKEYARILEEEED